MNRISIHSYAVSNNQPYTVVKVSLFAKIGIIERLTEELEIQVEGRFLTFGNPLVYAVEQFLIGAGYKIQQTINEKPEQAPDSYDIPEAFKMPDFNQSFSQQS